MHRAGHRDRLACSHLPHAFLALKEKKISGLSKLARNLLATLVAFSVMIAMLLCCLGLQGPFQRTDKWDPPAYDHFSAFCSLPPLRRLAILEDMITSA